MDRTGLFLFSTAFGKSLWLQVWRNLSSRKWAGAFRRVCSLSGAQTYWEGLIPAGLSIFWQEGKELFFKQDALRKGEKKRHLWVEISGWHQPRVWVWSESLCSRQLECVSSWSWSCWGGRQAARCCSPSGWSPAPRSCTCTRTAKRQHGQDATCWASAGLLRYLVTSYCTFCVRSTFSMIKSCSWHRLKGWPGGLRATSLLHLRAPYIAYRQIFGVSSMCCSTIFRETLVQPGPPSDGSLKDTETKMKEQWVVISRDKTVSNCHRTINASVNSHNSGGSLHKRTPARLTPSTTWVASRPAPKTLENCLAASSINFIQAC